MNVTCSKLLFINQISNVSKVSSIHSLIKMKLVQQIWDSLDVLNFMFHGPFGKSRQITSLKKLYSGHTSKYLKEFVLKI